MARILYIDDDAGLRRLAARALKRRGHEVATADGGTEGVAMAQAAQYDIAAVDHYMPGMDGLETLERLRALPEPPSVVYVTGSEEGRIAIAAVVGMAHSGRYLRSIGGKSTTRSPSNAGRVARSPRTDRR